MGYLTETQLQKMGFKSLGKNVRISDKASIYGAQRIRVGSNVRIDDFCVLSAGEGGIGIGNYVHIAVFASLIGKENILLDDFSGISARTSIYSSSDDYSGEYLTNPTVPDEFTSVKHGKVHIQKHVIVGANSVILPGITIGIGAAVGAMSLVTRSVDEFSIVSGIPARYIRKRKNDLLALEAECREKYSC